MGRSGILPECREKRPQRRTGPPSAQRGPAPWTGQERTWERHDGRRISSRTTLRDRTLERQSERMGANPSAGTTQQRMGRRAERRKDKVVSERTPDHLRTNGLGKGYGG